jgi:hypothetical protein
MHQKPTLREAKIAGSWPIKVAGALAQNASLIVHDLVGRWGYMAPPRAILVGGFNPSEKY